MLQFIRERNRNEEGDALGVFDSCLPSMTQSTRVLPAQPINSPQQPLYSPQSNSQPQQPSQILRPTQTAHTVVQPQGESVLHPAQVTTALEPAAFNATQKNTIFAALEADLPMKYKDNFHISRGLDVPEGPLKLEWRVTIRKRLMAAIKLCNTGPTMAIQVDYVMGGWSATEGDWKPIIVIFCADNRQKEAIKEKLGNLPNIMKGYRYVIQSVKNELSSGAANKDHSKESPSLPMSNSQAVFCNFKYPPSTLCGMKCEIGGEYAFTLGGVIMAGGNAYGLTTAHQLINFKETGQESISFNFIGSIDNDLSIETRWKVSKLATIYEDERHQIGRTIAGEYRSSFTQDSNEEETSWDWALIQLDQEEILPNYILTPYPGDNELPNLIEGFLPINKLLYGEVWVAVGPGNSLLGILIAETTLISFGQEVFEAYPIRLSAPLDDGSSGSWVVRGGKLCGYIFSRTVDQPWVYMLPIDPVFKRISATLHTSITLTGGSLPSVQEIPTTRLVRPLSSDDVGSSSAVQTEPEITSDSRFEITQSDLTGETSPAEYINSTKDNIEVDQSTGSDSARNSHKLELAGDQIKHALIDKSNDFAPLNSEELGVARRFVRLWKYAQKLVRGEQAGNYNTFADVVLELQRRHGKRTLHPRQNEHKDAVLSFAQNRIKFNFDIPSGKIDSAFNKASASALNTASASDEQAHSKLLLDEGVYVNAESSYYGNAIYAASAEGHTDTVRLLLERGADVNAQSVLHGTAIYVASAKGHTDIVRLLLDRGADINAQSHGVYSTAIQAASAEGHTDIVRLLLEQGADINAQSRGLYSTAIQAASAEGHTDTVRLLLDRGAFVNNPNDGHHNALQAASIYGHKDIVKIPLDGGAKIKFESD